MPSETPPALTQAPFFGAWLDDFFAENYRRRPVNATFIGVHDHDACLPDYSPEGVAETMAGMAALLARLAGLPAELLPPAAAIDRRLAEGFLRIQQWEFASAHFQGGNPCTYTGEAAFGIISLFLTDFAPLPGRVDAALARLQAIPRLLAQGPANLRTAPAAWIDRARRECQGLQALLGAGIERLIADERIAEICGAQAAAELQLRAARAAGAAAAFESYLTGDLRPKANAAYACGPEAFQLYLSHGHCLDLPVPEILAYAEEQLAATEARLAAGAAEFGAGTWQEALAGLAAQHPAAERYYARFTELWEACRALVEAQDLLTWPDFPIAYQPQPAWARGSAPYLYFLPYRVPAAYNRPPVHRYQVPPLDPTLPAPEQERFLRGVNEAVMKLNHVIHHGGTGHHVQNWHAYRAASRIGRVAAVDCAARIAMFCGGTMAEGWACYATELMAEAGFLTPLESLSELQTRLRMAARVVVDCRLHAGMLTLEEAAELYRARAGMAPEAALGEAVKNSMFPGAALMYLLGTDQIHALRHELASSEGPAFHLGRFHDRFLAYGSIPVPLICAEMRRMAHDAE